MLGSGEMAKSSHQALADLHANLVRRGTAAQDVLRSIKVDQLEKATIPMGRSINTEAIMTDSIRAGSETQTLSNPILDLAVAGMEVQLKAWQTFQVEAAQFVAKRLRANLEHMRALGHCCDGHSVGECQLAWLGDFQKDYAEECGRITANAFAIGFGELANLGRLFGSPATKKLHSQPASGP